VWCTKDACDNHLCEKCKRCSDCCVCEVRLAEPVHEAARPVAHTVPPEPEADLPEPAAELATEPEAGPSTVHTDEDVRSTAAAAKDVIGESD
jgi:hypothetical protein